MEVIEASLSDCSQADRPGDANTHAKERELYEESCLEALLGKYRGGEAEYIRRELELDLQAFYGGHPRVDDHTVVILQRELD